MKTYDEMFRNMYDPKLEIINFQYIQEKKPVIQLKIAEKTQNEPKYQEMKSKSIVESSSFPSIYVRNVTPKKGLFRRLLK